MDSLDAPSATQTLEPVLCRALIAPHLITGDLESAEEVVLRGIDLWNPDDEPEEQLVLKTIEAAVGLHARTELNESTVNDSYLGNELKLVLRLEPRLRACFVLRNLVGLSPEACARLLGLRQREIDEYDAVALRRLALFGPALQTELHQQERPPQHS
jgi:hypothetical protein